MPSEAIDTPITESNTVSKVKVTSFSSNAEAGKVVINFMIYLANDTPYKRGVIEITDPADILALYASADAKIAQGVDYYNAGREVVYEYLLANLSAT